MFRTVLKIAAVAALTLPLASQAADFDYSFVELDYRELNVDGPDADGFALRGSLAVHPNFFVFADYADVDFDGGADGESWRIGGGGHWPLSNAWDLFGKIGYAREEVENFDESGLFVAGGVRGLLAPKVEVDLGAEYADLEPFDELTVFAEGRYNFTNQLAAGLLLRVGDDVTTFGISGRFSF
jgi:hypothetical protein